MQFTRIISSRPFSQSQPWIASILICAVGLLSAVAAVEGRDDAVVRGKIAYDENRMESWDGQRLVVPFNEIVASLREQVVYLPPYPKDFNAWKPEQQLDWEKKFVESEAGKKFLEERKKRFEEAKVFDIKFEKDGSFVVYDVPVGTYGILGRVDKEFSGTKYGFEIFGQIEVLKDVDELILKPMRVEVTPILMPGQPAPPIEVKTHDDQSVLKLDTFKDGKYLFVNFWTSASPNAAMEQKLIQEMHQSLEDKYGMKLLSINVDADRKKVLEYIAQNELKLGSHGFTDGFEHRTLFDYGVRGLPSFWLIDKDGKIVMTQYEIAQAMRVKPNMAAIVSDRIEGKDTPTPAKDD